MSLNPAEKLTREEIRELQLERLQTTLNRAYFNVDFYRNRMDSLKLLPEETRAHLEAAFGVPVYGLYGVSEMVEPGIARCAQNRQPAVGAGHSSLSRTGGGTADIF